MILDHTPNLEEIQKIMVPFTSVLINKKQREISPRYALGLMHKGERKSMEPLAYEMDVPYNRVYHFITEAKIPDDSLREVLVQEALKFFAGRKFYLVIDDTPLMKQGHKSVGVGRQHSGQVGKTDNCQAMVTATLTDGTFHFVVDMVLFLPEAWTKDKQRMEEAGIPEEHQVFRTKPQIAAMIIQRLLKLGVRPEAVLSDSGYGKSPAFREDLEDLECVNASGISKTQNVYPATVILSVPESGSDGKGRKPTRAKPMKRPVSAQKMLEDADWQKIPLRDGENEVFAGEFAVARVKIANGKPVRIPGAKTHKLPSEEEYWLIGERRSDGEERYYLSNRPEATGLETLVREVKVRWACEQAHQQMKEELGLDHFEGRSWTGLHRHALMVMIAYYILQVLRMNCEVKTSDETGKGSGDGEEKMIYTLPAMRRIVMQEIAAALLDSVTCPCCGERFKLKPEHLYPNGVYKDDPVPYVPLP